MHLSLSDVDRFEGGSKVHLHCFLTRKDSRLGQKLSVNIVDPVDACFRKSTLFYDTTCFFISASVTQSKLW